MNTSHSSKNSVVRNFSGEKYHKHEKCKYAIMIYRGESFRRKEEEYIDGYSNLKQPQVISKSQKLYLYSHAYVRFHNPQSPHHLYYLPFTSYNMWQETWQERATEIIPRSNSL